LQADTILLVEDVWKRYSERGPWVLAGASLRVPRGVKAGIVGGNGTGKTTLLRIIAGLILPSKGSVLVAGDPPRSPRARARIGLVLHNSFLYNGMTVRENLEYYARLYGLDDYEPGRDPVVERLGLTARLDQPVEELSFGWRRRADLARALIHKPGILLLDEPFTGLDERGVSDLAGILEEYVQGGGAVLATAPKPGDLEPLAPDKVYRLEGGRLHAGER